MAKIRFMGRQIALPGNRIFRVLLGVACIVGGVLGFLPVLGFWMLPLGIIILSIDFAPVRRWRRKMTVRMGDWLLRRWPSMARRLGYSQPRYGKRV